MKNFKIGIIGALLGAGAGYAFTKKKKGQKPPLDLTAKSAIAGGLLGLLAAQLMKPDQDEIKLTIPQTISIERS